MKYLFVVCERGACDSTASDVALASRSVVGRNQVRRTTTIQ